MRKPLATEEFQENAFFRIGMLDCLYEFAHANVDAQFLAQFAHKARLERLVPLALAAGKLPQPAQMRISVPLRDEQFAIAKNKPGADLDRSHSSTRVV